MVRPKRLSIITVDQGLTARLLIIIILTIISILYRIKIKQTWLNFKLFDIVRLKFEIGIANVDDAK